MGQVFYFLLFIAFLTSCINEKPQHISPNGKIMVEVNVAEENSFGQPSFSISYKESDKVHLLFDNLLTGFKTTEQNLTDSLRLISISPAVEVVDEYTMITGKRTDCSNHAVEKIYSFENQNNETIDLIIRTYDDGVAFRYRFSSVADSEQITEEGTAFPIAEGVKRWIQPYRIDYEGFYSLTRSGVPDQESNRNRGNFHWTYPLLLEPQDSIFALITEANIQRNQCGSQLINADDHTMYRVQFS